MKVPPSLMEKQTIYQKINYIAIFISGHKTYLKTLEQKSKLEINNYFTCFTDNEQIWRSNPYQMNITNKCVPCSWAWDYKSFTDKIKKCIQSYSLWKLPHWVLIVISSV